MNSTGLSGGIGLFWKDEVEVELKNYSSCHIDVLVRKKTRAAQEWRVTGFYGAPKVEDRPHSWRFLRTLFGIQHDAWLCVGDFNETMNASEHFSNADRPEYQMRAFREAVDDCSLCDLGWSGAEHTWDNGQRGNTNVKARLDRGLGNMQFISLFPNTRVRHIGTMESDHRFVMVDLRQNLADAGARAAKQFRYEDVWQTHAEYDELVLQEWQKGAGQQGLAGVVSALGAMQQVLSTWGAKEFGNLTRKVKKLRTKLDRLRARSVGRGPTAEEKALGKQLREALRQEEIWVR